MGTGEGLGGEGTFGIVGMGDRGGREAAVGWGEAQRPPGEPPLPHGGGGRILYGENLQVSGDQ